MNNKIYVDLVIQPVVKCLQQAVIYYISKFLDIAK
jgi:hypothetical protein